MISAILLAAGQSRRMGTQKLALPIKNKPLLLHVFDELSRSKAEHIIVVVSSATEQLAGQLLPASATTVVNPDVESEMLASVRCGIRALPGDCEAVLVATGDQPGITAELINGVIATYRESRRGIVVPAHAGHRGHPTLFDKQYFQEILTSYDGFGLHALVEANAADVQVMQVTDDSVLDDIDVPADFDRFRNA